MTQPLVSVIIPAYNSEKTLKQAVDSALAQQVPLEVLVVDDCSSVPAMETLNAHWGDPRVKILRNGTNLGVSASRNRGVREAAGEYVAFLDADDWWAEGKLAAQIRAMRRQNAVLSCTGRELMNPDGTSRGREIPVRRKITYRELLRGNVINCSSAVVKTEVAREFPMEHDDAHEDYILWLRILKKYGDAVGLKEPYLKYRLSASGKSGHKWHSARMTYRVYRYLGMKPLQACACFIAYAFNGFRKYYRMKKHI